MARGLSAYICRWHPGALPDHHAAWDRILPIASVPTHQVIVRALLSCQISVPAAQVIAGYRADDSIVTRS